MKFTFKKQPRETGLSAVGSPYSSVDIKLDGKEVGYISAPNWQTKDAKWGVRFKVKKEPSQAEPSPWRWFVVKDRFDDEAQARQFVLDKANAIIKLNLYVESNT